MPTLKRSLMKIYREPSGGYVLAAWHASILCGFFQVHTALLSGNPLNVQDMLDWDDKLYEYVYLQLSRIQPLRFLSYFVNRVLFISSLCSLWTSLDEEFAFERWETIFTNFRNPNNLAFVSCTKLKVCIFFSQKRHPQ